MATANSATHLAVLLVKITILTVALNVLMSSPMFLMEFVIVQTGLISMQQDIVIAVKSPDVVNVHLLQTMCVLNVLTALTVLS